ncbi:MAG TPA: glycosyltransferase family 4 protein [Thermoanaerobaculia bacterium]|jgi:glycosyltransferase involved in cell wall biosynthesis|nr:glycosyltransferase family 4 protein [Thermoanaerobaculia bacterium]
MRILFMADVPYNPHSGAAGTEVQTLEALRALGHDVDAIWSDSLGRRIGHGNLHLLLELPRTYARAAARAVREKTYDVVHVNQPHGFRAARIVHRLSRGTVFIHRSHGFELNVEDTLRPWRAMYGGDARSGVRRISSRAIGSLLDRHGRAIAAEADGHIVSSSLDANFLRDRLGVAAEKVAVIPQAAPESYTRTPALPMTTERLGRVLHVAQFAFFKAPMITASVMNRLAAGDRNLRFTWVCDRRSEAAIRALLTAEANERMTVVPWTTQEALRDVYDAHGIFLFPSFFEGFGKAFLEAMSRGLCVVASDAGGMHDIIESGTNGILVPPGDATAIADEALAIARGLPRAAAMSAAAVQTARAYTWERVARETAAFYEARLSAMRR